MRTPLGIGSLRTAKSEPIGEPAHWFVRKMRLPYAARYFTELEA